MNKLKTLEEAKASFHYLGISVSEWSREHGFSQALVREVLAGRKKGLRGQAHNIAVALGIKRGIPTNRPARVQRARAAGAGVGAGVSAGVRAAL
jgi:gp16 family phage-associated protein